MARGGKSSNLYKASVYAAAVARRDPDIRVGRRLLVPTAALRRLLSLEVAVPQSVGDGGRAA